MPIPSSVIDIPLLSVSMTIETLVESASQELATTSDRTAGMLLYRFRPRWSSIPRLKRMVYFAVGAVATSDLTRKAWPAEAKASGGGSIVGYRSSCPAEFRIPFIQADAIGPQNLGAR